jgi:hypothetical protein
LDRPLSADRRGAAALRARSILIDGEAVACDGDGLPVFDRVRYRDGRVFLFAFDPLELNGPDMPREPLEVRKARLASALAKSRPGLQFNDHCDDLPADVVFRHACKLGFEGIVSKRVGSPYRAGRSRDWLQNEEPGRSEARIGRRLGLRGKIRHEGRKGGLAILVPAGRRHSRLRGGPSRRRNRKMRCPSLRPRNNRPLFCF